MEATIAAYRGEDQGVSEQGPERLKARIWVYGGRDQSALRQGPGPTRPPQSCLSTPSEGLLLPTSPPLSVTP